jgi:hypothetical protein
MKFCTIVNYLGWASGIFGGLLMLCGVIGFFTGTEFLGVKYYQNFFFTSNSFVILGIFLLVGTRCFCCCNCKDDECCKDEKKEK